MAKITYIVDLDKKNRIVVLNTINTGLRGLEGSRRLRLPDFMTLGT